MDPTEKKPAKVLDFLLRQQAKREQEPPSLTGLHFGCYALSREESVILSMPLFELILVRLNEGSLEAKQLAQMVCDNLGLTRS